MAIASRSLMAELTALLAQFLRRRQSLSTCAQAQGCVPYELQAMAALELADSNRFEQFMAILPASPTRSYLQFQKALSDLRLDQLVRWGNTVLIETRGPCTRSYHGPAHSLTASRVCVVCLTRRRRRQQRFSR
jgi:hypothetical protein